MVRDVLGFWRGRVDCVRLFGEDWGFRGVVDRGSGLVVEMMWRWFFWWRVL